MLRTMSILAVVGAVALAAGCGKDKPGGKMVAVSGTVTLDNQPMKDGEVTFVGDAGTVPAVLPVKDGAFKGEVAAGVKRVEIRAFKEVPTTGGGMYKPGEMPPSKENYLPARFNTESQTMVTIKPEGGNDGLKYDVTSR